MVDESAGLLVRAVDQPAVVVQSAVAEHPLDGGPCVRLQPARCGEAPGGVGVCPEEHEEQGGGVH